MKLKIKVHSLRHQLRQMRSLGPGKDESKMNAKLREKYQKWMSGDLEKELHELTLQHGYGKLPAKAEILTDLMNT